MKRFGECKHKLYHTIDGRLRCERCEATQCRNCRAMVPVEYEHGRCIFGRHPRRVDGEVV